MTHQCNRLNIYRLRLYSYTDDKLDKKSNLRHIDDITVIYFLQCFDTVIDR